MDDICPCEVRAAGGAAAANCETMSLACFPRVDPDPIYNCEDSRAGSICMPVISARNITIPNVTVPTVYPPNITLGHIQ